LGAAPRPDTDADRNDRGGKFRIANAGTLFRDKVGGMPLHQKRSSCGRFRQDRAQTMSALSLR